MKMNSVQSKLFIVFTQCFTLTLSNLSSTQTIQEDTTRMTAAFDVENATDFKEVDYCATSEIQRHNYSFDYSWTVKGINGYFLDAQKKADEYIHLSIGNLKFHKEALNGNWSITLAEMRGNGAFLISMGYEPSPEDSALKIDSMTGELWLSIPWSKEAIEFHTAHFQRNEADTFTRPTMGRSPNRPVDMVWQDRNMIQQIVDQFREIQEDSSARNSTLNGASIRRESNLFKENGQVDEINFIFHVDVYASQSDFLDGTSPSAEPSKNCRLGNAKSQARILRQAMKARQTHNLDQNNPLEMTTAPPMS